MQIVFPKKENIAAIIVAHNPPQNFSKNLESLTCQVGKMVIINSGPHKINFNILPQNAKLISNDKDFGQGRDLNLGAAWAKENGFNWFLLMDQDSFCHNGMVEELIKAYISCPFKDKVGAVGSNCIWTNLNQAVKYSSRQTNKIFFERDIVMATGTLLSREAFEKSGFFREEFFIDSIDTDYSLKLRKAGFKIIIAYNAKLNQEIGNSNKFFNFFGKKIVVTNHSAKRCYFMTRNGLILVKEYFLKEPYWALRRIIWHIFVKPGLIVLYEEDKLNKLKFIFKGVGHALIGKYE